MITLNFKENTIILYGLENYMKVIDKVIMDLDAHNYCFDVKLILTEALTNAFKHGNKSDKSKPIYLKYYCNGEKVRFEIKDQGTGLKNNDFHEQTYSNNLLEEHGRGLFLIKCVADKVELNKNTLIIEKNLK